MQRSEFSNLIERCPECGSSSLIRDYNNGETVCTKCGFVTKEPPIDRGPEWKAFTFEEKDKRARAGPPTTITIHDKGLSTEISPDNRDYLKRKLTLETKFQMYRLRKWQYRSRVNTAKERNLARAMTELDRLSGKLNIPKSVKKEAAVIYRKALNKGLIRGRSINGMIAAALYVACRFDEILRTLREIVEASLSNKKEIAGYYRFLLKELNLKMPVRTPVACISKIAEKTGISGPTQGKAVEILNRAREKRLVAGKDPMSIAAAVLYIACKLNNEEKTQSEIAEAAQLTEVTVRNRYKDINEGLKLGFKTSSSESSPKRATPGNFVLEKHITKIRKSISEIAGELGLSKKTQKSAEDIFCQAKKKNIFAGKRRSINGFAGAILRIACQETGEVKTQKEIAEVAEVPGGTISNYYCHLRWKLKLPYYGRKKYRRAS
jgi:transcription initiation factor TFIIB